MPTYGVAELSHEVNCQGLTIDGITGPYQYYLQLFVFSIVSAVTYVTSCIGGCVI